MKKTGIILMLVLVCIAPKLFSQKETSDTIPIDEVIVTANRTEINKKNTSVAVSMITAKEIDESDETAILPVISDLIPGVFVTQRGLVGFGVSDGAAGQISIRGIGGSAPNTQVLMLIDGHPQFVGIFGHPIPDTYVSSDIEKVEVIRGPASALYGTNALGGVINLITKKQKQDGTSLNARASYGSYNSYKLMGSAGYKSGKLSIFASVNHQHSDGHRDTMEFKIKNGYLKVGYDINKHINATVDFNIADFVSDDPGPESDPTSFSVDITRGKTALSITDKFSKMDGGFTLFYNIGHHELSDGWISDDANIGANLYQSFWFMKNNLTTIGADYKNYGGRGNGGMAADEWKSVNEAGVYIHTQQTIMDKLVVNAALRLENNEMFGTELIPQIGASFKATEQTTLKANYSEGFRSPTIMELYLYAPNPDLKPEEVQNYEVGINQAFLNQHLNIECTAFYLEGSNVIVALTNDNPPPDMKRQNHGSFEHKGIEFSAKCHQSKNFNMNLAYTYINMKDAKVAVPEHQLYLGGRYTFGKFNISANVQQVIGLYTLVDDEELGDITQDYMLLNAKLTCNLSDYLRVFVSGQNLLDQEYEINYDYSMPGATFYCGAVLKLFKPM